MSCASTASQRQFACSSLPGATALQGTDQFITCGTAGACMQKKQIQTAAEGGSDARLVLRPAGIKFDVHDTIYFGEANPAATIEQFATQAGVIATTPPLQVSFQNNYNNVSGTYTMSKTAYYKTTTHLQLNFLTPNLGQTRNLVYAAILQNGIALMTDLIEAPVIAGIEARPLSLHHIAYFTVGQTLQVMVWIDSDPTVNTNVTFSVRSHSIEQIC